MQPVECNSSDEDKTDNGDKLACLKPRKALWYVY